MIDHKKITIDDFNMALSVWKERSDYKEFFRKYLKVRDRETSEIVPFEVNSEQERLIDIVEGWEKKYPNPKERPTLFVVILKSRRLGFSTCVEGIYFKNLSYEKNRVGMIVSFDDDSASNINDMSNIFYQHLPQQLKPDKRDSRGKGLIFENPDYNPRLPAGANNDPGLQSKFLIETARNMNAGSSYNIHYLHLSELAKWQGDIKATMTSLLQAVPSNNGIVIVEFTAMGFNYAKDLWDEAIAGKNSYIPIFAAWHEDKGCRMPYMGFELTTEEHPRYGNEKELKKLYNLSDDQLEWRRWCIKNKCSNDLNQFKQEYPACHLEAFLMTGRPVFDNVKIIERIENLKKIYEKNPPLRGNMEFEIDSHTGQIKDDTIKFAEDKNGNLVIYEKPKPGYPYADGGDIAEGGSDLSAHQIINNVSGVQVAVWWGHTDTDRYAKMAYAIGKYYNDALVGIEMNFDSHPIKELERLGYWHQYQREVIDSATNQIQNKHGFRTTSGAGGTRQVIIDNLKILVRDEIEKINDLPTLEEMLSFVRNKDNKPEAMSGKHDDLVMALAIAYYVRSQQWTTIDEEADEKRKRDFDEDSERDTKGVNSFYD